MQDIKSRKRSPNWENKEKYLLRECIKKYIAEIENKATDTNTNKKKILAWQSVGKSFNELNDRERTLHELKQQWRVLKINAKKEKSAHKRAQKCTGGGEKPPSPSWETVEIINMIPQEFSEEYNIFDSDQNQIQNMQKQDIGDTTAYDESSKPNFEGTHHASSDVQQQATTEEYIEIEVIDAITASEESSTPNVEVTHHASSDAQQKASGGKNPPILKDIINTLKETRKQKSKKKIQEVTDEKVALHRKIQDIAMAEHQLKMKQLKESHEWAQEIFNLQKKEAELRIKNLILKNALLSTHAHRQRAV